MFNRKLKSDNFNSLIGFGMTVNGAVDLDGTLKVEGAITGQSLYVRDLIIAGGTITATNTVKVDNLIFESGSLTTKVLVVSGTLRILKDAQLSAEEVRYGTLEVEPGAILHDCKMTHLPADVKKSS